MGFSVRLCDFRSVSFDLWLSSLAMVAALVCWFCEALAVYLLQQALPRQAFSGFGDGGARTAMRLRLVLVSFVIAYLFVIFITFWLCVLIINGSTEFAHKKAVKRLSQNTTAIY
jgi:hypothetical protein